MQDRVMPSRAAPPRPAPIVVRRSGDRVPRPIELEVLARQAGVHPDLVARLVRLGLLETVRPSVTRPQFPADSAARLARAVRLRRDLGLNYAGAVLAVELLARIDELEARLSRSR